MNEVSLTNLLFLLIIFTSHTLSNTLPFPSLSYPISSSPFSIQALFSHSMKSPSLPFSFTCCCFSLLLPNSSSSYFSLFPSLFECVLFPAVLILLFYSLTSFLLYIHLFALFCAILPVPLSSLCVCCLHPPPSQPNHPPRTQEWYQLPRPRYCQ